MFMKSLYYNDVIGATPEEMISGQEQVDFNQEFLQSHK